MTVTIVRKNTDGLLLFFFVLIAVLKVSTARDFLDDDDFGGFSMLTFVPKCGYPIELHSNVETDDGYLLDMYRIPNGRNQMNSSRENRPVVLVMHGLLGCSDNWVVMGPDKGLAFLLADRGYDVWLGNARGTKHSRKHKTKNPDKDREYWQFSFHEIGIYDLPAKIDYIMKTTKQNRIHYIGHSQGTTSFFVMCSEKSKYNQHIQLMVALAPVAYCSNIPHAGARVLSLFERGADILLSFIGYHEVIPNLNLVLLTEQSFCREVTIFRELCANFFFLISGYDSHQLNRTLLPRILKTVPAGASTKQFYHFGQLILSGYFQKYDYGPFGNIRRYDTIWPPEYEIRKTVAPVALFYSGNDWLSSKKDVDRLSNQLPNLVQKKLISYKWFNHIDYIFANDGRKLLYDEMFLLMDQFT